MQPSPVLDRPAHVMPAAPAVEAQCSAAPEREGGGRWREPAQLLVVADGSASSTRQLVWSLQEAARREAIVLAVAVLDAGADDADRAASRTLLDAQLLHAIGQTGVHGRARTALLDPAVVEALTGAAGGADLVVVRSHRKTVLRPAVPRPPVRRPLTRCV